MSERAMGEPGMSEPGVSEPGQWWRQGVFYQLYVPSFGDGDGDGFGDLHGVEQHLDYIERLGVDAVWLSPVYRSPMLDFGYDVADYTAIDPAFGDLPTFDRIVAELHRRGIRVLLDFIPQHTSSSHPWFRDALSGRGAEHRDWYLWADPSSDGGPPNNWASAFGGPAWTLDEASGQYYYHAHLPQQPSLNWRNPLVKQAMFEVMRFWLRRGVDGFRVDAVWRLIKDESLRDNPEGGDGDSFEIAGSMAHSTTRQLQKFTADQPELPGLLAEMRQVADEFDDRVLMGELHLAVERVAALGARPGLDIPMNFALIDVPWDGRSVGELVTRYEAALTARSWPNWTLGNHDRSRVATRIGGDRLPAALTLLLTLRGTPTVYYGDELGLPDQALRPDQERDCAALAAPGQGLGRDPQRSPMPWDTGATNGFTAAGVTPWLPAPTLPPGSSAAEQEGDPGSLLNLFRTLTGLRRAHSALRVGAVVVVNARPELLMYTREYDGEKWLIVLNFSGETVPAALPGTGAWVPRFNTGTRRRADSLKDVTLMLAPFEACLLSASPA